jgi:hypothetical protein
MAGSGWKVADSIDDRIITALRLLRLSFSRSALML